MLLKLTLFGLRSLPLLHSFTIRRKHTDLRLRRMSRAPCRARGVAYFGYHSNKRTSIPVPSKRFWNTFRSDPR
jgi:hypothetical protein